MKSLWSSLEFLFTTFVTEGERKEKREQRKWARERKETEVRTWGDGGDERDIRNETFILSFSSAITYSMMINCVKLWGTFNTEKTAAYYGYM